MKLTDLLLLWPPFGEKFAGAVGGPYEVAAGQAFCTGAAAGRAWAVAQQAGLVAVTGSNKGQVTA